MNIQKKKMLSGKPYIAFDKELLQERQYAKGLIYNFNLLHPEEIEKRNEIIKKLFDKVKGTFFIEPPFRCDYGYNIEIGDNFYSNYNLIILDCARVIFGDNVMIGPNVGIYTAGHPLDHEIRNTLYEFALPITIGDNVWIGGNVVINPNIKIGNNSVIGSGSVVTKNIPDNVIAAGNPCRVLRELTADDKIYYYKNMKFDEM
ncbi:MAG: sugar O-acetyltransferase [Atribacterota bacterium]|nr:sugar O-acetyltransferase [Atribacterota bacterium]